MASTNQTAGLTTPPPTPPSSLAKAQILTNVFSLATAFATCVEAFNLIHPHKDSDRAQKIALTKLGIQQGRLLIFGDAVGISAPPASIATHMVPSHPGLTNPDPTLPVNFGVRDARLDEEAVRGKVLGALEEIAGRPVHLSREELMERYGLKQPKRFSAIEHPALDTNRLEAFREKYALLRDLINQSGIRAPQRRQGSMAAGHWTVKDSSRFEAFVRTVRIEVDGLIALMGVKEQVDRGMKTDIKAMAWHPDLQSVIVRKDWEKLQLIREAVADDYPEYVEVADRAITYIVEELRDTKMHMLKAAQRREANARRPSNSNGNNEKTSLTTSKEKRPSFWSRFSGAKKKSKHRTQSTSSAPDENTQQRSLSDRTADASRTEEETNALTPVRSKSLSAIPDSTPFDLTSRLEATSISFPDSPSSPTSPTAIESNFHALPRAQKPDVETTLVQIPTRSTAELDDEVDPLDTRETRDDNVNGYTLVPANTVNSMVERHDMFRGVGRIETRDIREKAREAAGR